jgi:hypothetical protein
MNERGLDAGMNNKDVYGCERYGELSDKLKGICIKRASQAKVHACGNVCRKIAAKPLDPNEDHHKSIVNAKVMVEKETSATELKTTPVAAEEAVVAEEVEAEPVAVDLPTEEVIILVPVAELAAIPEEPAAAVA